MARSAFQAYITNPNDGGVLDGAQVTVALESGDPLTIYEQQSGGVAKANPFTVGSDGKAVFYAEPGIYRITATQGGITSEFRYYELGTAKQPEQFLQDFGDLSFENVAPLAKGGTGAITAEAARTNLDVYRKRDDVGALSDITSLSSLNTAALVDGQQFSVQDGEEVRYFRWDETSSNFIEMMPAGNIFSSVAEMKSSIRLAVGQIVRTVGYYSEGDGGANEYEIVAGATDTADGGSFISLDNGLQAKGLFKSDINVKQWGAAGDGTTDDTSGIQAALNYSGSESKLYIPQGVYNLSSQVSMTGKSVSLFGDGMGATVLYWKAGSASEGIKVTTGAAQRSWVITDLTLKTGSAGLGSAVEFIHETGSFPGPVFRNVEVADEAGNWLYGFNLTRAGKAKIDHCFIGAGTGSGFMTAGIRLADNSTDVKITSSEIYFCVDGIKLEGFSEGPFVSSCTILSCDVGVRRVGGSNAPLGVFTDCHIATNKGGIIWADGSVLHVMNCDLIKRSDSAQNYDGILLSGASNYFVLKGNTIRCGGLGGTNKCISLAGGDLGIVQGNILRSYDTAIDATGATNSVFSGNKGDGSGVLFVRGSATNHAYDNFPIDGEVSFTENDTTPDVGGFNIDYFLTNSSVATTITRLDNGFLGQIVYIHANDGNTTIQHGLDIKLEGGVDFPMSAGAVLGLRKISAGWREISRRT